MQTSETIKEISIALVGFHAQVGKVGKDSVNPHFRSKFASLSNILESIKKPLLDNGLTLLQFPEGEHGLTTRLLHKSGEWMEATYFMKPSKDDPQGRGSAMTYQRRYAVGAILSLDIDDDDDGNGASRPQGQKAENKPETPSDDKPWLNEGTEAFQKALLALKEGKVTIQKIQTKYKLSKEMRAVLEAAVPVNA